MADGAHPDFEARRDAFARRMRGWQAYAQSALDSLDKDIAEIERAYARSDDELWQAAARQALPQFARAATAIEYNKARLAFMDRWQGQRRGVLTRLFDRAVRRGAARTIARAEAGIAALQGQIATYRTLHAERKAAWVPMQQKIKERRAAADARIAEAAGPLRAKFAPRIEAAEKAVAAEKDARKLEEAKASLRGLKADLDHQLKQLDRKLGYSPFSDPEVGALNRRFEALERKYPRDFRFRLGFEFDQLKHRYSDTAARDRAIWTIANWVRKDWAYYELRFRQAAEKAQALTAPCEIPEVDLPAPPLAHHDKAIRAYPHNGPAGRPIIVAYHFVVPPEDREVKKPEPPAPPAAAGKALPWPRWPWGRKLSA